MTSQTAHRRLIASFFTCLWLCCALIPSASAAQNQSGQSTTSTEAPIVVVGFSGLLWDDISEEATPHLYAFVQHAAGANIVVRTVGETTCPSEGWLTISAGQRVVDSAADCRIIESPQATTGSYTIPLWDRFETMNEHNSYSPHLGLLGDSLAGTSLLAIGPGAALALSNSHGTLNAQYADVPALPGSTTLSSTSTTDTGISAAADAYRNQASGRSLVVVDLGSVRYPDALLTSVDDGVAHVGIWDKLRSAFQAAPESPQSVRQQITALDERFGKLLESIQETTPNATVIATSVGDSQTETAQLGFFSESRADATTLSGSGDQAQSTLATSEATRQLGLVQLTDITPTLLTATDATADQDDLVGSTIEPGGSATSGTSLIQRLVDDQRRSQAVRPLVGPFYIAMIAAAVAVAVMGIVRHSGKKTTRRADSFPQFCAWVAALPVSSLLINLVPWWQFNNPGLGVFGGIMLIAAMIAWLATRKGWRDPAHTPALIVGGISAGTLLLDVLLDSVIPQYPLQLASLLGTQPQVGGRFYGLNNATFAVFAAGLLLVSASGGERIARRRGPRFATAAVLLVGIVAVYVDGSARFGADFGGPPALIVGFGFLAVLMMRFPLTRMRVLGILFASILVSLGFAVLDYLKPAQDRSHLGRFIQSLLNGGGMNVITRKLSQSFFGLPWFVVAVILAVITITVAVLWGRYARLLTHRHTSHGLAGIWHRDAVLRNSVISLVAALAIGFFINDSGIVVPAVGLIVALPLWLIMMEIPTKNPGISRVPGLDSGSGGI